jgi:hypothetical protein
MRRLAQGFVGPCFLRKVSPSLLFHFSGGLSEETGLANLLIAQRDAPGHPAKRRIPNIFLKGAVESPDSSSPQSAQPCPLLARKTVPVLRCPEHPYEFFGMGATVASHLNQRTQTHNSNK